MRFLGGLYLLFFFFFEKVQYSIYVNRNFEGFEPSFCLGRLGRFLKQEVRIFWSCPFE
jgi:hypothetical protein